MTFDGLSQKWASHFGLALSPLFERNEIPSPENHAVLLNGGFGSFALSISTEQLWKDAPTANWAWSSNLPHHVTVTEKVVAVTRWDRPRAELLTRTSVESKIDEFYAYLVADRVRAGRRVVDYLLGVFKRIRSLVSEAQLADERSTEAFLAFFIDVDRA